MKPDATTKMTFPTHLPLVDLQTAHEGTSQDLVRSSSSTLPAPPTPKNNSSTAGSLTIIDFWTTRCIKCPQALDRMNQEAQEMMNKNISSNTNNNIHFVSICLGTDLDTCRNVLEQGNDNDNDSNIPKWNHLTHYYARNKEAYKEAFSFQQVPYYVVVAHNNDNQEPPQILYKGTKINFQDYYYHYQLENEENRDNNCATSIPPSRELSMDDFDLDF